MAEPPIDQDNDEGSLVVNLAQSPDPAVARVLHGNFLPAAIYSKTCRQRLAGLFGNVDLTASGINYADDLIERMAPRDPAEEMLIAQMLMAHARVMHLTAIANEQQRLEPLRIVNEYADRASNTYRRLMLALLEYRKPPRGGDSFTAIKQANIAGQQVVINGETSADEKATIEQGCGSGIRCGSQMPSLPTQSQGSGIPSSIGESRQAVEELNRS